MSYDERIKFITETLNLSKTQLAKALGISRRGLYVLTEGESNPRPQTLERLLSIEHMASIVHILREFGQGDLVVEDAHLGAIPRIEGYPYIKARVEILATLRRGIRPEPALCKHYYYENAVRFADYAAKAIEMRNKTGVLPYSWRQQLEEFKASYLQSKEVRHTTTQGR